MNVEIFQSGHLFLSEDHQDGALPLVTGVTENEGIGIVTLVGRKLWNPEDHPGERPYVWSVRLPSTGHEAPGPEGWNEFQSAVDNGAGERALHEARTFLRGYFQCGDLLDEDRYLEALIEATQRNVIVSPTRADPDGTARQTAWEELP